MSTGGRIRGWASRFIRAWVDHQAGLTTPIILGPIGIIAMILGEDVSRAFTNVGGGADVRILGAAWTVGSVTKLWGIWRNDPLYEVVGLVLITLGSGIYVVGDLLGLGMLGLLAAAGHVCVIASLLGRVHIQVTEGRDRDRLDPHGS